MANKDDYLTSYREFFEDFAQTVNPNDQLPVKLASYKLLNVEVVGAIIDWTTQYLSQKKCPPHLFAPIIKIIIEEIRKACKRDPIRYGFNNSDNAYEPLKLMQAVMAKANEVCLRYLDNSMLCSLPTPTNSFYLTSAYAIRNKRRTMEDRHVVIHDLNTMFNIQETSPSSYYAVFDGHAGHDAAAYSSAHLHQYLAENKYFISNPEQALIDAFCKTDALFLEKCRVENLGSGTTAVAALLRPKEKSLYIAWVGDSQAIVVNQGKILQCVNPHKPCREDERKRIEDAGGCVMFWGMWRVSGQLAVSRAIGDADYKPHVIAIPDVREVPLDGGEDFVVLACDGLWDVVSEDRAAQEVYYLVAENPDNTERISNRLADLAKYQGSTDNISVIVVFLKDPHKIAAEAHRWATTNLSQSTDKMDTELDNANNPFTNSNGTIKNLETDNIHLQKNNDGLLLNLTDNFKASGEDFFVSEKSNGTKRSTSDVNSDDDLGPETNVDSVDDAFSPVEKTNSFGFGFSKALNSSIEQCINELKNQQEKPDNNNPLDESTEFLNKEEIEDSKEDLGDDDGDERVDESSRISPTNEPVHDVSGVEENPADSDSEDEWNYIKGDQTKEEIPSSQPETVVETPEDTMSQLNPNAAEFVPISPTRSAPSPTCRSLINEEVISQSPRRPLAVDISVPNQREFEKEIKSRPSEVGYSNGLEDDDLDEGLKEAIDAIASSLFQTSMKLSQERMEERMREEDMLRARTLGEIPEFQPGAIAAKLASEEFHFGPNATPFAPRAMDESSENFSTKANYGDETEPNLILNESDLIPLKEPGDPMSMSFYAEKGESNPFDDDLNRVHQLPDNLDEFLLKEEEEVQPIQQILEHYVREKARLDRENAEQAVQTTDLDKLSQEDEKELASPLEPDHETEEAAAKSPETRLVDDDVGRDEEALLGTSPLPETESPAPDAVPEVDESNLLESPKSPVREDISEASKSPVPEQDLLSESPLPEKSKSPVPDEQLDLLQSEALVPECKSPLSEDVELIQPKSPVGELSEQPSGEIKDLLTPTESQSPLPDTQSPVPPEEEPSHVDKAVEPSSEDILIAEQQESENPVCELTSRSPTETFDELNVCSKEPSSDTFETEFNPKSEVEEINPEVTTPDNLSAASPTPACEYTTDPVCEQQEQQQSELVDLQEPKPEEDITSSVKDDISSPIEPMSPVKSPEPVEVVEPQLEIEQLSPVKSPVPVEKISVSEPKETIEELSSAITEEPLISSQSQQIEEPELDIAPQPFDQPAVVETEIVKEPEPLVTEQEPAKEPEPISKPEELDVCPEPVATSVPVPELVGELEAPVQSPDDVEPEVVQEPALPKETEVIAETEVPAEPQVGKEPEAGEPEQVAVVIEDLKICEKPGVVSEPEPELVQTQEFVALESAPLPPTSLSNGFNNLIGEVNEEISIKTESIQPEFAEQTVITPSEESKLIDNVPTAPLVETPVEETQPPKPVELPIVKQELTETAKVAELIPTPEITVKSPEPTVVSEETPKEVVPVVQPLPIEPVVPAVVKKDEKKPAAPSPSKKPIGKVAPSKSSTTASKTGTVPKTTAKPLASPKTATAPKVPPKTGTSRLSVGPTKTAAPPTRLSPKPKTTTTTAPKSTEKKPLANGEVKMAPRTLAKTTTAKPTARHSLPATKSSTTTTKTTAAPKPASAAPRTTAPRPTTVSRTATSTTAAKPRTTTLTSSKTSSTVKSSTSSTLTASKTTTSSTVLSPRTSTAPKPRTLSSVSPKPKVPLTKTVTKSADVEKQNKESANKITASRTTTVSRTTTSSVTGSKSTTVKKDVQKTAPKRPGVTKTSTTTTTKTTVSKKPGEVKTLTKTKTTKVEKPKENGIAPASVTEEIKEITIVTNNVVETETLLKDNSPIDNKLLVEGAQSIIEATPAD